MIRFSNPTAFFWALLAAPIVLLYLAKTGPRRQTVATGFLWAQALQQQEGRSWWRPWRRPVSLGIQLAVLGLIVLAMAGPMDQAAKPAGETPATLEDRQGGTREGEAPAEPDGPGGLRAFRDSLARPSHGPSRIVMWLVASAGVLLLIEWSSFQRRWTC